MDEILSYLQFKDDTDKIARTVETLYFKGDSWNPWRLREEYRFVRDLTKLKDLVQLLEGQSGNAVSEKEVFESDFRSRKMKYKLNSIGFFGKLTPGKISSVQTDIIKEYDYFPTALLIVDIMNKKRRQYYIHILITILLGMLTSITTILTALVAQQQNIHLFR